MLTLLQFAHPSIIYIQYQYHNGLSGLMIFEDKSDVINYGFTNIKSIHFVCKQNRDKVWNTNVLVYNDVLVQKLIGYILKGDSMQVSSLPSRPHRLNVNCIYNICIEIIIVT